MKVLTLRLKPGLKLKQEIEKLVQKYDIKAGFIISCVGGLNEITCRMAGAKPEKQDIRIFKSEFELVSLTGTISKTGCHLHIAFSDEEGRVLGGHLKEAIIHPTADLTIGLDEDVSFDRKLDKETGFKELTV